MNRKSLSLFAAVMTASVMFAGCAGDDGEPEVVEVVDKTTFELEAGKGAIAGLLVDDRFRPLELTDEPVSEFQYGGFVLLQETGQQVQSNENGEFTFVDLDPGTYTLRANIDGHESTPQRVSVDEGVFNEISVVARRVSTVGSAILTEEFSIFIPCAFATPAILLTFNCVLDLSGDSFRSSVTKNYTIYPEMTFLIAEGQMQNEGYYSMPLRDNGQGCPCYGRTEIQGGNYGKVILANDPAASYDDTSEPWDTSKQLNIGVFLAGGITLPTGNPLDPTLVENNLGADVGVQGDFLVSMFMGEPDVDLEQYCVICGEATA